MLPTCCRRGSVGESIRLLGLGRVGPGKHPPEMTLNVSPIVAIMASIMAPSQEANAWIGSQDEISLPQVCVLVPRCGLQACFTSWLVVIICRLMGKQICNMLRL